LSSTISISTSLTTNTVGEGTTISGAISPVREGVTITIQYRPGGGAWGTLATVKTDADGRYSYTWTSTKAGTYEVKAGWEGDAKTLADEGQVQVVTVQEAPSSLPYAAAGIAVIVIAAVVIYVVKMRTLNSV
jgi:5-hydroxyisourate hydrolase-like protein (transthyretin family)